MLPGEVRHARARPPSRPPVSIRGIPLWFYWTVAAIAVILGLLLILRTERTVRTMRRWLLRQLRWVRTPGYRRYVKLNGWALFVLGMLMLVLLSWVQRVG